jgi:hypothetical protein
MSRNMRVLLAVATVCFSVSGLAFDGVTVPYSAASMLTNPYHEFVKEASDSGLVGYGGPTGPVTYDHSVPASLASLGKSLDKAVKTSGTTLDKNQTAQLAKTAQLLQSGRVTRAILSALDSAVAIIAVSISQ